MITQVQKFIFHNKLLQKESKIIVGLSGGPDSMVLIHILIQLGYECIAAHCNFHLRGEDSNNDEKFVVKWCEKNGVLLETNSYDTIAYASKNKISIEMAARDLRYEWFEKLRVKHKADSIAIAHHRDDSIETILINLIRGTGIKGLTGIPVKNNHIVRPLLSISRNKIMEYLSNNQVPYVTDITNEEDIYTRNTLRLKVLPLLEEINTSVRNSILTTSSNLQEVEKIYNNYIINTLPSVVNDSQINIAQLKKTYSPQSLLFEILSPLGFTSSVIVDISNNLDSIPGKIYLSNKYRLIKDREHLIISEIKSDDHSNSEFLIQSDCSIIDHPFKMTLKAVLHDSQFKIEKRSTKLHVDFDKLTFPLILRKWKHGDWFIPLGMSGKKKLSDFFTDNRFNLVDKEETWVITSRADIVWIVNHRMDNRFRITNDTRKILTIDTLKQS